MVILEIGRWLLAGAAAAAWLLVLDAIALAWPSRDRSDRALLLFVMAAVSWAAAFEGNQAWHQYLASPIDLMALTTVVTMWAVLGLNWIESRRRSTP